LLFLTINSKGRRYLKIYEVNFHDDTNGKHCILVLGIFTYIRLKTHLCEYTSYFIPKVNFNHVCKYVCNCKRSMLKTIKVLWTYFIPKVNFNHVCKYVCNCKWSMLKTIKVLWTWCQLLFFLVFSPLPFFNWFNDMWMLGCTQNIQPIHGHAIGTNDDVWLKSL